MRECANISPYMKRPLVICDFATATNPSEFLYMYMRKIWLYRETWPGSSLSSRRAPRQTCHGHGANLRPPASQAAALPKELSRQLIRWLFGTSTWPGAGGVRDPLQGCPSACVTSLHRDFQVGRLRIIANASWAYDFYPNSTNGHADQSRRGHHYRDTWPGSSLSSRRAPRQTCHGHGANLRPPASQAAPLPKELSRQLIRWLFGTSTWPGAGGVRDPLQFSFLSVCYLNLNLAKATPHRLMRSSPNLKSRKKGLCFPYTRSLIYCQLNIRVLCVDCARAEFISHRQIVRGAKKNRLTFKQVGECEPKAVLKKNPSLISRQDRMVTPFQ